MIFYLIYHIEYQRGKTHLSRLTRELTRDFLEIANVRLVDVQPGNTRTNIDRGIWTTGNNTAEMDVVDSINRWWREKFGNDPKNVAEIIYQIAEGRINSTTVYVGWDTKIGRAVYLLIYPLAGYRLDSLFFAASTIFYQFATWANMVRG